MHEMPSPATSHETSPPRVRFCDAETTPAGRFLRRREGTFVTWKDPNACNTVNTSTSPAFCGGSGAFNINVFGVIAGTYMDTTYVGHGLIRYPNGLFKSYEVPGAGDGEEEGTSCPGCSVGLNFFGATAGYYTDSNDLQHYLRAESLRASNGIRYSGRSIARNELPLRLSARPQ